MTARFIQRLLRPSLVQRVFLSLLLAFGLVLVALEAYTYLEFRQAIARDQGLKRVGRAFTVALSGVTQEQQAVTAMQGIADSFRSLRVSSNPPGSLLIQLQDLTGRILYSSPALGTHTLAGADLRVQVHTVNGRPHWVYQSDMPLWSLRVAEPEMDAAWVLNYNLRRMLPYLLVAFPVVLIPVWLAVWLGMKPLQRLADRVATRGPTDLSPIGLDAKYAEIKPLVAALDGMLAQLRAKVERERAFVQDAAHEMRTPMAVISAQAHALAGAATAADRAQARAHLEHAIARASHLTQQLLELASFDDAQRAQVRAVDLAQLVRQVIAQAAPAAIAARIELRLEAPDSLAARVDVAAFQSLVENLLNNALLHARGATQIAVGLQLIEGLQTHAGWLQLTVEDDGPGIASAERERVFERFWRGADAQAAGTGLGLAIVRQAAARMGGTAHAKAGLEGVGAGFHVRLPLQPGDLSPA
ncbi:MAG: HAMP domain-containing histidine kinase [Comamonadaceae bacterium]|nr:MAG: HAMP domain-containing histidine kinase [Comamonadaceae bacterium]